MTNKVLTSSALKNSKSKKALNKLVNRRPKFILSKFDSFGSILYQSLLTRQQYLNLKFKEYVDASYERIFWQVNVNVMQTPEPVCVSKSSHPLFSKLNNITTIISSTFFLLLIIFTLTQFNSIFINQLFNNKSIIQLFNFSVLLISFVLLGFVCRDSILTNVGKAVLPLTFLAMPLMAQNQVTGHVESVPTKNNAFARVTMTNTSNSQEYTALTDTTTGNFEMNIPTATYQRKVEVQDHFLFLDTLNIDASQYMDLQAIQDIGKETTYYDTILEIVKVLTRSRDPPLSMNTIMERWHDEDQPIKVWKRNYDVNDPESMPPDYAAFYDSAKNDVFNKSNGEVVFSESQTPVDIGINFIYVHGYQMPIPGSLGYTEIEEYYPDNSPKKVKIYINRDNLGNQVKNFVFRREFMRALATVNASLDPTYIQAVQSQAEFLHNDEGKVLQIMYTLKNGTDMKGHQYTVIQDPLPVELTTFNALTDDNIVKLLWNTATEINNYGFEVQRKLAQWDSIGFVPGNGNSNSPKDYTFLDTLEMPGIYTYRLKQVDNDGTSEYSPEVQVDLTKIIKDYVIMQNYPNPFNPETSIKFKIPQKSHIKLTVYDILGKEIETLKDETLEPGTYTEKFDGKNLSSGVYIYRLQTENSNLLGKMTLLK